MDDRKIIGFCLEFYRMTKEDNRVIPVDEFLCFDGIPYCHKNTYRKIVAGENEKKEMHSSAALLFHGRRYIDRMWGK